MRGLAEFNQRAENGDALTVVFLGGSLTWGANASDPNKTSYRALTGEKLREYYPQARWRFIDAAIGGTGSQLGIFRLDRDVLRYRPDLVFLDFTLNDNARTDNPESLSSYEAIIRYLLANAQCPVIPVFLASRSYIEEPDFSVFKRRLNHLKLAEKYGLQAADVVKMMRDSYAAGQLDLEAVWPPELFDTTHPHDYGYWIYADCVWRSFQSGIKAGKTPILDDEWQNDDQYRYFVRKKITDLETLPKGWRKGLAETRAGTFDFLCSRWMDELAIAENCQRLGGNKFELNGVTPEPLTVKFYGSNVMLWGESTIYSGKIEVKIDDCEPVIIDAAKFGTIFTPSAYLYAPIASGLAPDREHTMEITPILSGDQPQHLKLESICVSGSLKAEVTM